MTKGLIFYQSKYGAAKRYAIWLAAETGFELADATTATTEQFRKYDPIIFCSGVYFGKFAGRKFLTKNWTQLHLKHVYLLAVGLMPPTTDGVDQLKKASFNQEMQNLACFYVPGNWDEAKLTVKDKLLTKGLHKMLAKKDPSELEPFELALSKILGQKVNAADPAALVPLLTELTANRKNS